MSFQHKTIEGQNLRLVPFNIEHINGLKKIAIDKKVWGYLPYKVCSDDDFEKYINLVNYRIDKGTQLFFTIIDQRTSEILDSTKFLNIEGTNKKPGLVGLG